MPSGTTRAPRSRKRTAPPAALPEEAPEQAPNAAEPAAASTAPPGCSDSKANAGDETRDDGNRPGDGDGAGDGATAEHVVMQLPIPPSRMDELLRNDEMSSVLSYNPSIQDPVPYFPEDHFTPMHDVVNGDAPGMGAAPAGTPAMAPAMPPAMDPSSDIDDPSHRRPNCFWCCHPIGHDTFGMPVRYDQMHGAFTLYGTFCSLECAAAHNFSVHMGSDRAWEIHSWIQLLGRRFGYTKPVRPAPSRYLLNIFQGPLTIEQFRSAHQTMARSYVLNIPPLMNAPSKMEILNTSYLDESGAKRAAPMPSAASVLAPAPPPSTVAPPTPAQAGPALSDAGPTALPPMKKGGAIGAKMNLYIEEAKTT